MNGALDEELVLLSTRREWVELRCFGVGSLDVVAAVGFVVVFVVGVAVGFAADAAVVVEFVASVSAAGCHLFAVEVADLRCDSIDATEARGAIFADCIAVVAAAVQLWVRVVSSVVVGVAVSAHTVVVVVGRLSYCLHRLRRSIEPVALQLAARFAAYTLPAEVNRPLRILLDENHLVLDW